MDAPEPRVEVTRGTRSPNARPIFVRWAIAWLAIVLCAGLWQGYGQWLLGGGAHVP